MNKFDYRKKLKENTNIITLTLMNKNHEIIDFDYEPELNNLFEIHHIIKKIKNMLRLQ